MRKLLLVTAILMANVMMMNAARVKVTVDRVDPTDWYVGMKNPSLQLMIYGKNIDPSNALSLISTRPSGNVTPASLPQ